MSDLKVNEIKTDAIKNQAGTSAATIDSSGRMTQPNIPFLQCSCTGYSGGNITPSGYTGKVPFQEVIASRGIVLDTSTNLFSVPVTGLYNISAAVRLNADYTYLYWVMDDRTDSSNPVRLDSNKLILAHGGGTSFTTCVGSVMFTLQTGKNYGMSVAGNSTSAVALNNEQTWMDVHLVG